MSYDGFSSRPKHVASNKIHINVAVFEIWYFPLTAHVSQQHVIDKEVWNVFSFGSIMGSAHCRRPHYSVEWDWLSWWKF
jgi:hypothetical protein